MHRLNIGFSSFKVKVSMVLISCMLLIGAMSNFLVYKFALRLQFNQLRDKLKMLAVTSALMIDADLVLNIPLNEEGKNSVQYKNLYNNRQTIPGL